MKRPPFWASFFTLCGVSILCTLGTWQVHRLSWKNDLIAKLETAYDTDKAQELDLKNLNPSDFIYGRISGALLTDKAFLLGVRMKDEKAGADLIIPVQTSKNTILINMGFTTGTLEDQPIYNLNNKSVWFEGLVREPSWNSFTPENNPEKNLWYRLDTDQIAKTKNLENLSPAVLYAERASHKFNAQLPNHTRQYPNNNHMQYALFWFSMAGGLLAVFAIRFMRQSKLN